MSMRSVNEIVPLRDNAMAMLKQGAWHGDGKGHRLLIRETEDLRLVCAGPLQMGAEEMLEEMKYFAAAREKRSPTARAEYLAKGALAEGARCYLGRRRQDGADELITYEPGEWEELLAQC
jgi:hypothetical protein